MSSGRMTSVEGGVDGGAARGDGGAALDRHSVERIDRSLVHRACAENVFISKVRVLDVEAQLYEA